MVAHGFLGHRAKPAYALLAEALARRLAVLTVDLRGHGRSGGRSTLGALEVLDVAACAAWLRARGHPWVCAIGASMGGAAVLRAAGLPPHGRFDAVCAVSAPAAWGLSETPSTRALTRVLVSGPHRLATAVVGHVRIASGSWVVDSDPPRAGSATEPVGNPGRVDAAAPHGWLGPAAPVDVVAAIAPTPLLVVHGVDDHVVDVGQASLLVRAAGAGVTGWLEPAGFGHAEDGLRPAFAGRLADAVVACARAGRWGEREAGGG